MAGNFQWCLWNYRSGKDLWVILTTLAARQDQYLCWAHFCVISDSFFQEYSRTSTGNLFSLHCTASYCLTVFLLNSSLNLPGIYVLPYLTSTQRAFRGELWFFFVFFFFFFFSFSFLFLFLFFPFFFFFLLLSNLLLLSIYLFLL